MIKSKSVLMAALLSGGALSSLVAPQEAKALDEAGTVRVSPANAASPFVRRRAVEQVRANRRRARSVPGQGSRQIDPKVQPSVAAPPPTVLPKGPLAPIGTALEAGGVTLHLLSIDAGFNNFDMGVYKGYGTNTNLVVVGADFDLYKLAGVQGGTIHFLEGLQYLRKGLNGFTPAYADLTAAWEPIYPYRTNQLMVLTYEQQAMDGDLTVEFGRSNPNRAFNLNVQGNITSNWNNVWYQDAGVRVPTLSSWMARAAYKLSPDWYVGAGAYEFNPKAVLQTGWDWDARTSTGALALLQLGYKTDFTKSLYPQRYELVGFYNSADQVNPYLSAYGRSVVFHPSDPADVRAGVGGFILNGQKTLWRADGGADAKNLTPTAVLGFAQVSAAAFGIANVTADISGGLILQAPDQARPFDTYGFKIHWSQISQDYQRFLQDANVISGGTGYFKSRNSFAYEINAHWQLTPEISIDPTIQYFQNANNYFNPYTPKVAKDGFFFGGTMVIAFGKMLGLSSGY